MQLTAAASGAQDAAEPCLPSDSPSAAERNKVRASTLSVCVQDAFWCSRHRVCLQEPCCEAELPGKAETTGGGPVLTQPAGKVEPGQDEEPQDWSIPAGAPVSQESLWRLLR